MRLTVLTLYSNCTTMICFKILKTLSHISLRHIACPYCSLTLRPFALFFFSSPETHIPKFPFCPVLFDVLRLPLFLAFAPFNTHTYLSHSVVVNPYLVCLFSTNATYADLSSDLLLKLMNSQEQRRHKRAPTPQQHKKTAKTK